MNDERFDIVVEALADWLREREGYVRVFETAELARVAIDAMGEGHAAQVLRDTHDAAIAAGWTRESP